MEEPDTRHNDRSLLELTLVSNFKITDNENIYKIYGVDTVNAGIAPGKL